MIRWKKLMLLSWRYGIVLQLSRQHLLMNQENTALKAEEKKLRHELRKFRDGLVVRKEVKRHFCIGRLNKYNNNNNNHLTASFPGQPGWAGTRKEKPIWILLKQETVSGSGIRWAICKSAPCSRQTTTPVPHHSVFYRPDALPAAQPTASKHWRHKTQ